MKRTVKGKQRKKIKCKDKRQMTLYVERKGEMIQMKGFAERNEERTGSQKNSGRVKIWETAK